MNKLNHIIGNTTSVLWTVAVVLLTSTAISFTSCRGNDSGLHELDLPSDSIVVDTLFALKPTGTPCASLKLSIQFINDDKYASVNQALMKTGILSVEQTDSIPYTPANMKKSIDAWVSSYAKDYVNAGKQILAQEPEAGQQLNWKYHVRTELKGGKNDNIVFLAQIENYEGGENSTSYTIARNIERKTGKILGIRDVFNSEELKQLQEDIVEELANKEDCGSISNLQDKGFFVGIEPYATNNFILTDKGITFIYIPGEIAPAEKGEIRVLVEQD